MRLRGVLLAASAWLIVAAPATGAQEPGRGDPAPASPPDRAADIDAFEAGFVDYDASLGEDERAEARARIEVLRREAPEMSTAAFELALAEIAALSGNAHSQLLPARWANDFDRLAVRFFIADDGLHVADAAPGYRHLVGGRIEAVEGVGLAGLREVWGRYATGRAGYRDVSLPLFLEAPQMLHAAGISDAPDRVQLALADGRTVEVGVHDSWPPVEGVWYYLSPARALELEDAGRVDGDPLYLRDPASYFRFVDLPERDAVYLQFRANVDFDREVDLGEASAAAIEELRRIAPSYVIVDQRFNIGGDLNTTRELMEAIPRLVRKGGEVFAITSGRTFSAGIASLGYLKQAAGGRLTIVGAPVGDELEFWAEGSVLELPSGALILRATERHNYRTGCPEEDCHLSIQVHPIRIDDLEPDFRPVFTYDAFVAGRDPYLEAVLELMNRD